MSTPKKLIIPSDEVWVQQIFSGTHHRLNEFMLEAKTTKKDKIRNAQFVPTGETLVIIYEKKMTNEDA